MAGTLSAERVGKDVKFTIEYPEEFEHRFMVERFDGTRNVLRDGNPVFDSSGNPVQEEVWTPIHTGTNKHVEGCEDWAYAKTNELGEVIPVPRATYRALTFKFVEHEHFATSGVTLLHTSNDTITNTVTV